MPTHSLGRRSFLAGLGALGAATLVGCNASASGAGSEAASPSGAGTFSYTDARDKVVEFALPATTVVAQSSVAATLLDFGYQVTGAYGELKPVDGKLSYQAGDLDVSKITVLSDVYGEFDVEKFAAMNPQVLIDLMFEPGKLWYLPDDLQTKVEQVSPTIGMEMLNLGLVDIIESFEVVAGKLGADLTASLVTDARKAFDDATAKAKDAIAAKPDLTVVGISRERRQGVDHQRRPGAGSGLLEVTGRQAGRPRRQADRLLHRDQLRAAGQVQRRHHLRRQPRRGGAGGRQPADLEGAAGGQGRAGRGLEARRPVLVEDERADPGRVRDCVRQAQKVT